LTGGKVDTPLFVAALVAARAVRTGEPKRELGLVEGAAVEIEADVTDHDN
jgi:hypothetical protein